MHSSFLHVAFITLAEELHASYRQAILWGHWKKNNLMIKFYNYLARKSCNFLATVTMIWEWYATQHWKQISFMAHDTSSSSLQGGILCPHTLQTKHKENCRWDKENCELSWLCHISRVQDPPLPSIMLCQELGLQTQQLHLQRYHHHVISKIQLYHSSISDHCLTCMDYMGLLGLHTNLHLWKLIINLINYPSSLDLHLDQCLP